MSQTNRYASGNHQVNILVKEDMASTIVFEKNSSGSFIYNVEGDGHLDLNIKFENNTDWTFLWLNNSDASLYINETVTFDRNAHIKMNYGELSNGKHQKESLYTFVDTDSSLSLRSATIAFNQMKWNMKAVHLAKRTHAEMNNFAIVLNDAKLHFEVTGQIDKGYGGSETHQMSRIMNLGDSLNAVVFPKLLIDENDVAASHAATVGQPNEEHIYYLQARGIQRIEALKLLMKGYLLPITDDIEDADIKKQLIEEIEMKVESQWI